MKKLICWVTFPFSLLQIQNILNCTDTEQLQGSLTDPDLHVISFFPDRIGRDVIRVSEIPFLHFLYSLNHFSHISINAIFLLFLFYSLHIASMLSNCTVKCEGVKGVLCCNTGFMANCSYCEDSKYSVLKSMLGLTISANEEGANAHKDNPKDS